MDKDLSIEAKQTFSVVTLLATILVVGIHYKSDIPDQPSVAVATWNQVAQEFWFGGIARVAVPVFAFAAGLFYFRSDDGTFLSYRTKFASRIRTVVIPFFIVASLAMVFWLLVRRVEGKPIDMTAAEFVRMWLLRPPAEQLWFLRDLMVLVTIAPIIRWCCQRRLCRDVFVGAIMITWVFDAQVFPMVAGWRLLQMETLLFFTLGCVAVSNFHLIEGVGQSSGRLVATGWLLWASLVAARMGVRADFDIWYADDHNLIDLLLHQASILVGVVTLFATAWRLRRPWIIRLSGGSFFVYLVHEFPLRAVAHRISDRLIDHDYSCWILTPIVLIGCYWAVVVLNRFAPRALALLTGGRAPSSQRKRSPISSSSSSSSLPPTQPSAS
ncbi:acyltransferase family protein [Rubripirellula reticaptiva]|uniref:Acyltransferase family protein n=1 Tax=Rubripirellula reticaptiva TaxID=2528013 RepID=A0A5C6EHF4_9BACT|nr:acyltransferase [Rubripirellula reticaptiva]TWU47914.1 Acyltransferase family protein [Rubripirellula reticaptiva]